MESVGSLCFWFIFDSAPSVKNGLNAEAVDSDRSWPGPCETLRGLTSVQAISSVLHDFAKRQNATNCNDLCNYVILWILNVIHYYAIHTYKPLPLLNCTWIVILREPTEKRPYREQPKRQQPLSCWPHLVKQDRQRGENEEHGCLCLQKKWWSNHRSFFTSNLDSFFVEGIPG